MSISHFIIQSQVYLATPQRSAEEEVAGNKENSEAL